MDKQIYLDYQSTKPVDPRVVDAMIPYFTEKFGNASALHKVGDIATDALEESRKKIASFINADDDEIIFLSREKCLHRGHTSWFSCHLVLSLDCATHLSVVHALKLT